MDDALKRLDKLTQEEARMAVAQNLKATHTVDERVRGVATTVVAIDDKVAGVDDRVAGVGDRVSSVDDKVAVVKDDVAVVKDDMAVVRDDVAIVKDNVVCVDDRVKVVDDKVDEVIHGAQPSSTNSQNDHPTHEPLGGKEMNMAMQQAANDLDQIKRSSCSKLVSATI